MIPLGNIIYGIPYVGTSTLQLGSCHIFENLVAGDSYIYADCDSSTCFIQ
ncbi:hypothetical protein BVRB_6g128930 [Beta vulgaris subsp. vulgaris]|nr:hypothetical protein BVRB_6g128930 [Beta vulgaris subsp. vulgaris]